MKTLFLVELQRLRARKLLRWLTIVVILGGFLAGTMAFLASDDSPQKVAAAQAQYESEYAACVSGIESGTYGDGEISSDMRNNPAAFCDDEVWMEDPRFAYEEMTWILGTFAFPMAMFAWLIGASAIGAEWQSRGITTSLTWEPRRARVLLAKLSATGVLSFAWVVAMLVLFAALMYPAAALRGTMEGVDADWWTEMAGGVLRVGAVGTMAAIFGMALATIGRNTAAAFGVGFAYLTVVEGLIRGFKPAWDDWLIGDNLALFMIGPEDVTNVARSQWGAGLLVLCYALALAWIALTVFRNREIA